MRVSDFSDGQVVLGHVIGWLDESVKKGKWEGETAFLKKDGSEVSARIKITPTKDKNGEPIISYIDQFPEPKNMDQGLYLQKLSDALEESKNKISFPLPVGSTIFSNNYFWVHGRKAFKEHSGLSRELLRIRGTFFN